MPSITRLIRLATLPETRRLVSRARRSRVPRDLVRRARSDPAGLFGELTDPATGLRRARAALVHPATRELAGIGLAFMPYGWLPIGWLASRLAAGRRVGRRRAPARAH